MGEGVTDALTWTHPPPEHLEAERRHVVGKLVEVVVAPVLRAVPVALLAGVLLLAPMRWLLPGVDFDVARTAGFVGAVLGLFVLQPLAGTAIKWFFPTHHSLGEKGPCIAGRLLPWRHVEGFSIGPGERGAPVAHLLLREHASVVATLVLPHDGVQRERAVSELARHAPRVDHDPEDLAERCRRWTGRQVSRGESLVLYVGAGLGAVVFGWVASFAAPSRPGVVLGTLVVSLLAGPATWLGLVRYGREAFTGRTLRATLLTFNGLAAGLSLLFAAVWLAASDS